MKASWSKPTNTSWWDSTIQSKNRKGKFSKNRYLSQLLERGGIEIFNGFNIEGNNRKNYDKVIGRWI